jgi:hypothetical protein
MMPNVEEMLDLKSLVSEVPTSEAKPEKKDDAGEAKDAKAEGKGDEKSAKADPKPPATAK